MYNLFMQFKTGLLICATFFISLTIVLGFTLALTTNDPLVFIETLGIISVELTTGGIGILITKRKEE